MQRARAWGARTVPALQTLCALGAKTAWEAEHVPASQLFSATAPRSSAPKTHKVCNSASGNVGCKAYAPLEPAGKRKHAQRGCLQRPCAFGATDRWQDKASAASGASVDQNPGCQRGAGRSERQPPAERHFAGKRSPEKAIRTFKPLHRAEDRGHAETQRAPLPHAQPNGNGTQNP